MLCGFELVKLCVRPVDMLEDSPSFNCINSNFVNSFSGQRNSGREKNELHPLLGGGPNGQM